MWQIIFWVELSKFHKDESICLSHQVTKSPFHPSVKYSTNHKPDTITITAAYLTKVSLTDRQFQVTSLISVILFHPETVYDKWCEQIICSLLYHVQHFWRDSLWHTVMLLCAMPPGSVKISHKKDGHQRRPHRFHVSRRTSTPPPLPAAWSATEPLTLSISMV